MVRKAFNQSPDTPVAGSVIGKPAASLSRRQFLIGSIIGIVAATGGFHRCGASKGADPPAAVLEKDHVMIGADTSTSFSDLLPGAIDQAASLVTRLDSERTLVRVCRVDYDTTEVTNDPASESQRAFTNAILGDLSKPPKQPKTRPGLFFKLVTDELKSAPSADMVVVYLSDFDEDDPKDLPLLRAAAKQIARNDHVVAVVIWGISASNRAAAYSCFQGMKDRLVLCGAGDMDIDGILAKMDAARSKKGAKR